MTADPKSITQQTGEGLPAVILLGHGSRVEKAGGDMERVAAILKERHGFPMVEYCFMSRLPPHFPETLAGLVARGATRVLVIPYFLHTGLHIRLDIPEMMQHEAAKYPGLRLQLGGNLGYDDILVDLVRKRIDESLDVADVREAALPGRESFPVPPGQAEFVPMNPAEAKKYRSRVVSCIAAGLVLGWCSPAWAMHIAEGILPPSWAGLWFAVAAPFLWLGLREVRRRSGASPHFKVLTGLVGAAVFVISCMPVPVPFTGTCSHPCGTGLAAIIVGPAVTTVIAAIALLLQALFLAHGGLTTLGANIVSMGVVGAYAGWLVYAGMRRVGFGMIVAGGAAGLVSDWATYAATSGELAAALHGGTSFTAMFSAIALAFMPTQLPLGVLEAVVSGAAVKFLVARRPEFVEQSRAGAAG